jgi:hypothetical protein
LPQSLIISVDKNVGVKLETNDLIKVKLESFDFDGECE